jgi:serine/threonine-protein kinase
MSDLARLTAALSDRYRIERELGAGGMATVYLAEDLRHARPVAVKVLRADLSAVLGADRFLNEIRVTANLQHPHVLPLFDSGEADGLLFYVMPLVDGESLNDRIGREKQLPVEEAVRITREVASALDYAHRRGVIHRDIKPANILLQDGTALVSDFGIALAVSNAGGARLTETGLSLGTPYYMSPEQATGDRHLDARSDVYSLGAVLYEMLTGDPPHTGSTAQAVIAAVVTEQPRDVAVRRPRVAPHVAEAVHRALEKLPADRFPSAGEFARALEGPAATAGRTAAFRAVPRGRRRWLPAALLVVAGAAAGALAGRAFLAPGRVQETRTRLTFTGDARAPAVSRDGRRLAYIRAACQPGGSGCDGDVVVQDLPAGLPTVLVSSARILGGPVWSPDGNSLLVAMKPSLGQVGLYVVSQAGGVPRKIADRAASYAFADDRTAGLVPRRGRAIRLVDLATGDLRDSVVIGGGEWIADAVDFSPLDGRIVFSAFHGNAIRFGIADRSGRVLDTLDITGGGGWEPDGRHVFLLQTEARGSVRLLRVAVSRSGRFSGRPVEYLSGIRQDEWSGFALTPTGHVIGELGRTSDIWGFTVAGAARRLTHSSTWYLEPDVAPDGRAVAYPKQDAWGMNVYVANLPAGEERAVTADSGLRQIVRWLPGGRRISYIVLGRSGTGQYLQEVTELETGRRRQLGVEPGLVVTEWLPDGTPLAQQLDGRAFAVLDSSGRTVRRFPLPDSLGVPSSYPAVAPDGREVALLLVQPPRRSLHALRLADGSLRLIGVVSTADSASASLVRWAADGFVYFARTAGGEGAMELWRMAGRGGAAQRVAALPVKCQIGSVSLSTDAGTGACLMVDERPDLWLVERHR